MAAIINNDENCHCDNFKNIKECKDFDEFVENKLNDDDDDDVDDDDIKQDNSKDGIKKKKYKNKKYNKNMEDQEINKEDELVEEDGNIKEEVEVDEELKCPKCDNMFNIPLLLPCMHFFCLEYVQNFCRYITGRDLGVDN